MTDARGRRRVLGVTSSFPVEGAPGASTFLGDWARELGALGNDVHVLAPAAGRRRGSLERRRHYTVETFGYARPKAWQSLAYGSGMFDNMRRNPLAALLAVPLLARMVGLVRGRAVGADLVHAHWLVPSGLAAALACHGASIPLVVTVHSTDLHLLKRLPFGRDVARFIAARASALHFVAPYLERSFREWLSNDPLSVPRTYVVPMGFGEGFTAAPLSAIPRLGFLGRLVPIKGVDALLHACASVGITDVTIAGDGCERDALHATARRLGVPACFLGRLDGAQRSAFFRDIDVVVFPSRRYRQGRTEGTPVAVLEALRSGRIVVASETGGIGDVITDGVNGFLVPPDDTPALASRLRDVVSEWHRYRAIGRAAPASVAHLSAARVAAVHDRIYTLCGQWQPHARLEVAAGGFPS